MDVRFGFTWNVEFMALCFFVLMTYANLFFLIYQKLGEKKKKSYLRAIFAAPTFGETVDAIYFF